MFQTSLADAVKPPESLLKYVVAAFPPYATTCPAVAVIAASVVGFSPPTPVYTWHFSVAQVS